MKGQSTCFWSVKKALLADQKEELIFGLEDKGYDISMAVVWALLRVGSLEHNWL